MKLIRLAIVLIAVALVILIANTLVSAVLSRALAKRVGNDDYLAALERRISIGMQRREVEANLDWYRGSVETKTERGLIVSYGYWFGFLPTTSSGILYAGEVVVTYSSDERVLDASHWYN
jgi:hypothetical protein